MRGAIRKREILAHPLQTVRCFGWPVFLRALLARRGETFLSVLTECRWIESSLSDVPMLFAAAAELERRARGVYLTCAHKLREDAAARRFFMTLSRQEEQHAEILLVCRQLARGGLPRLPLASLRDALAHTDQVIAGVEAAIADSVGLRDILRLTLELERSEINQVFAAMVAAADSPFVHRLRAFQRAGAAHIAYIAARITAFAPELAPTCAQMVEEMQRGWVASTDGKGDVRKA